MRLALYNLCTIEDEMSELLIEKQSVLLCFDPSPASTSRADQFLFRL